MLREREKRMLVRERSEGGDFVEVYVGGVNGSDWYESKDQTKSLQFKEIQSVCR